MKSEHTTQIHLGYHILIMFPPGEPTQSRITELSHNCNSACYTSMYTFNLLHFLHHTPRHLHWHIPHHTVSHRHHHHHHHHNQSPWSPYHTKAYTNWNLIKYLSIKNIHKNAIHIPVINDVTLKIHGPHCPHKPKCFCYQNTFWCSPIWSPLIEVGTFTCGGSAYILILLTSCMINACNL